MIKKFDEQKAIALMKSRNVTEAEAGLKEDWFWTAGSIKLIEDKLVINGAFLESYWATPVIEFTTEEGFETINCYLEFEVVK